MREYLHAGDQGRDSSMGRLTPQPGTTLRCLHNRVAVAACAYRDSSAHRDGMHHSGDCRGAHAVQYYFLSACAAHAMIS